MKLNLSPFKSVGPFKLGESIDKYLDIVHRINLEYVSMNLKMVVFLLL